MLLDLLTRWSALPRRVRTILVFLVASGAYIGLVLIERWPIGIAILVPVGLVEVTWAIQWSFRRIVPAFHAAVRRHNCDHAQLPMSRIATFAIVIPAVVVAMSVGLASAVVAVVPFLLLEWRWDLGWVGRLAAALLSVPLFVFVLGVVARLSFRVKAVVAILVALDKPAPWALKSDER